MTTATSLDNLVRRRFSFDEFMAMAEAGIFGDEEHVELIRGEIVEMAPVGPDHGWRVAEFIAFFAQRLTDRGFVWPGSGFRIGDDCYLEPDIALLRLPDRQYKTRHPCPDDVLLIIEVASTSLRRDRHVKAALYASGIHDYWVIHEGKGILEVFRDPQGDSYRTITQLTAGATIAPLALPDLAVPSELWAP